MLKELIFWTASLHCVSRAFPLDIMAVITETNKPAVEADAMKPAMKLKTNRTHICKNNMTKTELVQFKGSWKSILGMTTFKYYSGKVLRASWTTFKALWDCGEAEPWLKMSHCVFFHLSMLFWTAKQRWDYCHANKKNKMKLWPFRHIPDGECVMGENLIILFNIHRSISFNLQHWLKCSSRPWQSLHRVLHM